MCRLFSSGEWELLLVVEHGFRSGTALGNMVSGCGTWTQEFWFPSSMALAQELWGTGFIVSVAHGTFPDQGWNSVLLRQADFTTEPPGRPHSTPFRHRLIPNFILKVVGIPNLLSSLFPLVNTVYVK